MQRGRQERGLQAAETPTRNDRNEYPSVSHHSPFSESEETARKSLTFLTVQRRKLSHRRLATRTATAELQAPTAVGSGDLLGHRLCVPVFMLLNPNSSFHDSLNEPNDTTLA